MLWNPPAILLFRAQSSAHFPAVFLADRQALAKIVIYRIAAWPRSYQPPYLQQAANSLS